MTNVHPIVQPVTTQEILDELDQAINNHLAWLKGWHRRLLCRDAPLVTDLAYDPHHLCRFGAWYVKNQHRGLVNQPVIRNLASLHRDIHERAEKLIEGARGGGSLPQDEYDAFQDAFAEFVAQARRLEKAFARASSDLDPLTGLHNRQAMLRDLERERERAIRSQQPCCIALGDLDHFKRVNDTYGHSAGDRVLLATAERFLHHIRPYDSVYRYGGEEFLFCLPDADLATARHVLDRLREMLAADPIGLESGEFLPVTGSFGVAAIDARSTVAEIVERADQALYWAKDGGRNRVCGWDGPPDVDSLAADNQAG